MDHSDHVACCGPRYQLRSPAAVWADIGAGSGAFTLALADLLGPGAQIIAIDRDPRALDANRQLMAGVSANQPDYARRRFHRASVPAVPGSTGWWLPTASISWRAPSRAPLSDARRHLRPGGSSSSSNTTPTAAIPWVPNPFSARAWIPLAERQGWSVHARSAAFRAASLARSTQRPLIGGRTRLGAEVGTSRAITVAPGMRDRAVTSGWRTDASTIGATMRAQPVLLLTGVIGFALRGGIVFLTVPMLVLPTSVEVRFCSAATLAQLGSDPAFSRSLASRHRHS